MESIGTLTNQKKIEDRPVIIPQVVRIFSQSFIEDNLKVRQPQWKTISLYDNLNARGPQWKMTSIEDYLNGRQPQWKTTSK